MLTFSQHAVQRKQSIQDYVSALVKLPKNISACQHVRDFFSINDDDIAPPTEAELQQRPPNILEKAARLIKGDFCFNFSKFTQPIPL